MKVSIFVLICQDRLRKKEGEKKKKKPELWEPLKCFGKIHRGTKCTQGKNKHTRT